MAKADTAPGCIHSTSTPKRWFWFRLSKAASVPNISVWPQSTIPTWVTVTTATTPANTIVWQSCTTTTTTATTTVINPIYFYSPHPAYNHAMQQLQQQQFARNWHEANMAYQNQLNQQQFERHAEAQARRDYAATEAARVIEPNREAAAVRARDLLLQHLNEEQRRTFLANKWFVVEGGRSKRKYRVIDQGNTVANVHALDAAGNVAARLCAHGRMDLHLPLADHLLTQKIMLELDEDTFLRTANFH